jgi:hypothetical protein
MMDILVYKWDDKGGAKLAHLVKHPLFKNDSQQIIIWVEDSLDVDIKTDNNTYQIIITSHADPS